MMAYTDGTDDHVFPVERKTIDDAFKGINEPLETAKEHKLYALAKKYIAKEREERVALEQGEYTAEHSYKRAVTFILSHYSEEVRNDEQLRQEVIDKQQDSINLFMLIRARDYRLRSIAEIEE